MMRMTMTTMIRMMKVRMIMMTRMMTSDCWAAARLKLTNTRATKI